MEPVWEEVKPQSKKPYRRPFQDPPRRSYPDNSDKRKVAQLVYHLAVSETKQNVLNSKYEAESRLLQAAQDQLNLVLAEKRHLELSNETNVAQLNSRLQNQQDQLDFLKKQLDSHNPLRDQLVQIQNNVQEIQHKLIPGLLKTQLKTQKSQGHSSAPNMDNLEDSKIDDPINPVLEASKLTHKSDKGDPKQVNKNELFNAIDSSQTQPSSKDPTSNDATSITLESIAIGSSMSETASIGNFEKLIENVLSKSNYKSATLTPNSLVLALDQIMGGADHSKQASPKANVGDKEKSQSVQVSTSSSIISSNSKADGQSQTDPVLPPIAAPIDNSFIIAPIQTAVEHRPKKTTFQLDNLHAATDKEISIRKDTKKDASLLFFSDNSMIKTLGEIVSEIEDIKINSYNEDDNVYLEDVSDVISSLNGL